MGLRISDSVRVGPLRVRVSKPLSRRGRTWVSVGGKSPIGWLTLSKPVDGKRRRR